MVFQHSGGRDFDDLTFGHETPARDRKPSAGTFGRVGGGGNAAGRLNGSLPGRVSTPSNIKNSRLTRTTPLAYFSIYAG